MIELENHVLDARSLNSHGKEISSKNSGNPNGSTNSENRGSSSIKPQESNVSTGEKIGILAALITVIAGPAAGLSFILQGKHSTLLTTEQRADVEGFNEARVAPESIYVTPESIYKDLMNSPIQGRDLSPTDSTNVTPAPLAPTKTSN